MPLAPNTKRSHNIRIGLNLSDDLRKTLAYFSTSTYMRFDKFFISSSARFGYAYGFQCIHYSMIASDFVFYFNDVHEINMKIKSLSQSKRKKNQYRFDGKKLFT